MAKTILVVDDSANVRTLVREYLTADGFRVVIANDGRQALFVARDEKPDLILLDIMMPGMGGYEFLRAWRKERQTPVILLTAKVDETDKVLGLELGADDYVTKPFGMRELVARIRAVLRRANAEAEPVAGQCLRVADVTLDMDTRLVRAHDRDISLTPSEFELLALLMASPGRVFSRAQLLESLQGASSEGVERTVDVHIRNLRTKVEIDPGHPQYIETVFGVGYRFREDQVGSELSKNIF